MTTLLQFLLGTWFISYTNFPMWTKGNKTNPSFTYTLIEKKDGSKLLFDEVKYLKKGKSHSIKGYDHPGKENSASFTWRGKGILSLLKSQWKVALKDEQGQWAVIYFSKTLFTPEGVDIIGRAAITEKQFEQIKISMLKDSLLKDQVHTLQRISK